MIRLKAGVALAALMMAAPAWADEAGESEDREIIVTGERAPRTLAETSSSVAVRTGEQIDQQGGSDRIQDVLALIPNVHQGASGQGPTIRGQDTTGVLQGADAFLGGARPRATLLVDGRTLSQNEYIYGLTGIWDVDRVEVYRGPQTTTQGRNAIAGAIFINTRNPSYKLEGAARAIIADYNTQQLSGAIGGPIIADQLAARISVDWRDGDQFIKSPLTTKALVGTDPDRDDFFSVRGKLLVEPTAMPGFRALLTLSHARGTTSQVNNSSSAPFRARTLDFVNALFGTDADTAILDLDQDLGGGATLSTRLTYADVDVTRYAGIGDGNAQLGLREKSVEPVLRFGRTDSRLTGLVGGYLFDNSQKEFIDLSLFLGVGNFRDKQKSRAVFGEATYKLTDRLSLTGGGRYQYDRQDRRGSLAIFAVDYHRSFEAFLPKATVAFQATPHLRVGATAARGFNPGGTTISFNTGVQDEFGAEKLWNYELFIRAETPDRKFSVNANLFYTDYEDAQRPITTLAPNGMLDTVFDNAEDAHAIGFELEASYRPSPRLGVRGSLGLLDTRLDRYSIAAVPIEGKQFQRAPRFSTALAIDWTPVERFTFDAQATYESGSFGDDLNDPSLRVNSIFNIDAQASYRFGKARVFVFARNLFDRFELVQIYDPTFAATNAPRRIGGGVEVRF